MYIQGTIHDDTITGTSDADTINVRQGGNDTVNAGDGNDIIQFGAAFTAQDSVDGGAGLDVVSLNGDYTGANAVTFLAGTIVNVERLQLASGHSYDLATDD